MKISNPTLPASAMPADFIAYRNSLLDGVEIKRCKGNPYDCKTHVHNELSVGYIQTGSTELTLHNETLHFTQGDGVMIPPLLSHCCAPDDIHQWEYVMLYVHPVYYARTLHFSKPKKLMGKLAATVISQITQLVQEQDPITAETILLELLLSLSDTSAAAPVPPNLTAMQAVRNYIVQHLQEPVPLQALEQLTGMNKFTLIRHFKKVYTTTPASFHLQCRVAEAKKRLAASDDVLSICADLHFYDQPHLIREFRKMYGTTPSAYIEQLHD